MTFELVHECRISANYNLFILKRAVSGLLVGRHK